MEKKPVELMTRGKFEIMEGAARHDESESDSDSDNTPPVKPPGESSKAPAAKIILDLMERRYSEMKEEVLHLLHNM